MWIRFFLEGQSCYMKMKNKKKFLLKQFVNYIEIALFVKEHYIKRLLILKPGSDQNSRIRNFADNRSTLPLSSPVPPPLHWKSFRSPQNPYQIRKFSKVY